MSPEDLRELILAVAALVAAATPIVLAFLRVNQRVDNLHEKVETYHRVVENDNPPTPPLT